MTRVNPHIFIHYVIDADYTPFGVDAHTHGLDRLGMLELQCVCPFSEDDMADVLNGLAFHIDNGHQIEEGIHTGFLSDNYRMAFIKITDYTEPEKEQLRLIYPDENNKLPWDEGCNEQWARQIEDLPEEVIRNFLAKCN